MRFAVNLPNIGDYADPAALVELARLAEANRWDGFFVWDHVTWNRSEAQAIADPWILLTAVALSTTRLRIGTMVTPVARRRPAKLVRETVTLDHVSAGRVTLGVGLGAPLEDEFGALGEPTDPVLLAQRLDEGLAILDAAWSGERVSFRGSTQTVDDVTFAPRPVQRPRIPVWVGGTWGRRGPLRRALRWDGAFFTYADDAEDGPGWRPPRPDEIAELGGLVRRERGSAQGFDIVVGGRSADQHAHLVEPLAAAGATWWQEWLGPAHGGWEETHARIALGPPEVPGA